MRSSTTKVFASAPTPAPYEKPRPRAKTTKVFASASTTPPSDEPRPLRAVVVGGGPGGLATAICLASARGSPRPWRVDVFEARPQADVTDGTDERRTYGMVVGAERALKPLVAAGVDARKVVSSRRLIATAAFPGVAPPSDPSAAIPLPQKAIAPLVPDYGVEGATSDVDDPTRPGSLFMIDRAFLVRSLAEHIEGGGLSSRVNLHWGSPLASLDAGRRVARFDGDGGGGDVAYDLLVACDGGSSAARRALEDAGLLSVTELPSPVSLTDYKTFHGLDDEGAEFLGLDTSGRGTTFAMFAAPPPPPPAPGATGPAAYKGSMAAHRRPGRGSRCWSGLLSQPPGVFESLRGSPPEAYEAVLDGILGAQDPDRPWFPPSWRREILRQLAAEPGEGGGDVGRLARLLRASALAVPSAGVALVGDAATTNTPQLGQGAASAIEDAATLASSVTEALAEAEKGAAGDDAVAVAVSRGLEAYDAKRRRARYALQDMEREVAVALRPPPPAGQEPAEDAEARAAWKEFFANGRKKAARRKSARGAVARVLFFSKRVKDWAEDGNADDLGWWNAMLHSTTPYDEIYSRVRGGGGERRAAAGAPSAAAKATAVVAGLAAIALTVARRAVVKA